MDLKEFKIKAAIFDLDGTIADSLDVWTDIDSHFFCAHGKPKPATYQNDVQCMDFASAAAYTKKLLSLDESEEEIMEEWRQMSLDEYSSKILLKDGAVDFLKKLHQSGVKLGLATASGRELYEPLLRRFGVYDYFGACVTTTEAGKNKDFPDVYLLCADKLDCDPNDCAVFEDILPGILSAKSVGMTAVGVYDKHSKRFENDIKKNSDIYINSFNELI